MEFVVFFQESSPNQELSRFWLINEIFNFLFLNQCLVTKMSWEFDFYKKRLKKDFLLGFCSVFSRKFSKSGVESFLLINEIFNFLFLNQCLFTKMSWEIN